MPLDIADHSRTEQGRTRLGFQQKRYNLSGIDYRYLFRNFISKLLRVSIEIILIMEQTYMLRSIISISLIIGSFLGNAILLTSVNAQSTEPKDVFKVIVTLTGITSSTQDILIIVNVGDHTKSKLLNAENTKMEGANKVNYTLTFPGSFVDKGDKYTVCVMTVKNFKLQCDHANNSRQDRPELVDINLTSPDMDKKGNDKGNNNT